MGPPWEVTVRFLVLLFALSAANLCAAGNTYVKDMAGKDYFPLGVNYAWQDWGVDFSDQGWAERFPKIEANLDLMKARGVRTVRWWIYTDFVTSPLWEGEGKKRRCVGMPEGWVKNFLKTVEAAHARGIKLYPVFSSFDLGRKGFKEVVSEKAVRKSFIEKAVRPILEAAATHEGIFAWDIINEPEWLVRKEDGGDPNKELSHGPLSLKEVRAYVKDMAREVHTRAKQPVSVGSAGLKWCGWQYDFYSGLGLDFFDVHYYDWMTPWFDITSTPKSRLAQGHKEYGEKPIIVGETIGLVEKFYTGKEKPKDHGRFLRDIIAMGYSGYLPWAWNERPDSACADSITPHFNQALRELSLPGQAPPQ